MSLLIVSFLPMDSCVYDTHSKCAPWINTVWFVCMQQGDGTFQARGTGVYEDLPCGLVRDCKIRRLREVSPFLRSRVVWVKNSLKKIDVSALCGTLGMKYTYFSRASPPEFRAARNHQFSFHCFFFTGATDVAWERLLVLLKICNYSSKWRVIANFTVKWINSLVFFSLVRLVFLASPRKVSAC